jgi:NAD(P)H dehydrogenase (quinone)
MFVITGATGKLGRLVTEALLRKVPPTEVAVAVRTPSKASDLAARGVEVRHLDYDRRETLAGVFHAGDKVLLISSSEVGRRAAQHLRVGEAARKAGVSLLAYTSLLRADTSRLSLAPEHSQTEEAIRSSGVPYVFLRNGWYVENHTDQLDVILERGAIVGAAGSGRHASAARKDYADAAVAVLTASAPLQPIYELAGADGFTLEEFAAEVTRQTGKKIAYSDLTPGQYRDALVAAGLPGAVADLLVDFDLAAARGDLDGAPDDLRRLIGRSPTSLREAIASALDVTAPVP